LEEGPALEGNHAPPEGGLREGDRIYPSERRRRPSGIPIVGQVAAGRPILAMEHMEGRLDLGDLYGQEAVFAVRVKGESMRDAGILDGDLAIVRAQRRVANGQVALAYLGEDQEATVKIFRWRRDHVELQPRNPDFEPVSVGPEDPHFRVGGKVIGVVRSFR
jgi:repressor LexA